MSGQRFKVVEGSQSGHCCFEATVVDTTKPTLIGGRQYKGSDGLPKCEQLCECFEPEDAELICAALNKSGPYQAEQAENIRRAAEAGLKRAQFVGDSRHADVLQHIIDLVATLV